MLSNLFYYYKNYFFSIIKLIIVKISNLTYIKLGAKL